MPEVEVEVRPQGTTGVLDPYALAGRVIVITGAGQGIGRVFAKSYAAAGATPIIAEINKTKADSVAREIADAGGRALAVHVDVADPKSVEAMARETLDAFGRIDVLVNNAALFSTLTMRPFDQIPLDEWDQVMRVNVTGVFLCCRAVAPAMRKANWGRIITMSSGAAAVGPPNYLHYPTSKAAVVGLTRALARELGPFGITVNALMPGATYTEIERKTVSPEAKERIIAAQCIHRAETSDDLVGAALFLSSEASRFITGQTLSVDGGLVLR